MPAAKPSKPTVADVLKAARKKYDLRIGSLAEVVEDATWLTTGNLAIDTAIGGGVPLRRSVEFYGAPSSGKTSAAIQTAVELQRVIVAGGDLVRGITETDRILYLDYEQALDVTYARSLGLDLEHPSFLFSQPDNLEDGAEVARELISTGEVRLLIVDSVASMTPKDALEAEVGKASVAVQARLMSNFLRPLNALLSNNNCAAIFVNHIADVIEMGGGRPGIKRTTTPGGRALKFYASVRCEFQQVKNTKGATVDALTGEALERVVATDVRVRVVKNKVGPPFREAITRVRFGRGFDNFWTAMQVLVARGKVVVSAGYFYFERSPDLVHPEMSIGTTSNRRPYIRGEAALFEFADEHPEWRAEMIEAATALAREHSLAPALGAVVTAVDPHDAQSDPEEETDPARDVQAPQEEAQEVPTRPTGPSLVSVPSQGPDRDVTAELLAQ